MKAPLVLAACLLLVDVAVAADPVAGATAQQAARWVLSQVKAALKKGNTPPTDHPLRKVFEECVESVEPVQLEAAAQQTLLAHLGEADLKISDQFFESPAGAKFFVRDKPPSAQERELLDFLATSASEKLRVAMTTPAGRAPINKKIEDLVAACGAAHQGKSS